MARSHQYLVNYRTFRRYLGDLLPRLAEDDQAKVDFVLSFANDTRRVVDYLIADADALEAFEQEEMIILDLQDRVASYQALDRLRRHPQFARLTAETFDALGNLLYATEGAHEPAYFEEFFEEIAPPQSSLLGVGALLRVDLSGPEQQAQELVFWNIAEGSPQVFVELSYKLLLQRLPDIAGYFSYLKALSAGETTRKAAVEAMAYSDEVLSQGMRWRAFWL